MTECEPDPDDLFIAEDERGWSLESVLRRVPDGRPEDRYGWYCSNCDCLDTAMDPMGRIEGTGCGDLHKPRECDAAFLRPGVVGSGKDPSYAAGTFCRSPISTGNHTASTRFCIRGLSAALAD